MGGPPRVELGNCGAADLVAADAVYFILTDGSLLLHAALLSPTKYPKIALLLLRSNLDLKNCLQQFRYNLDLPLSQPHDFHGWAEQ